MKSQTSGWDQLFHDLLNLKKLRRTGWQLRGIRDGESLADHAFGVGILTMFLVDKVEGLDTGHALQLAMVHELGECRVGDIPFPALKYLTGKSSAEQAAVVDILEPLGEHARKYQDLFVEFEEGKTREARFVRAVDKLEMLITAAEYERTGYRSLTDFWENPSTFKVFEEFPLIADLAEGLRGQRSNRLGSGCER